MTSNNNILPITFSEYFSNGYIRVTEFDAFSTDFLKNKTHSQDPDDIEILAWLNENTPGWDLKLTPGAVENVKMPVGRDPVLTMRAWRIDVFFVTAAHRDLFRARQQKIQDEHHSLKARVKIQRANAPNGVVVCDDCATFMEPKIISETARYAQFAFKYPLDLFRCPHCGMSQTIMNSNAPIDVIGKAEDDIIARVGLPHHEHSQWSEDIALEWRRRRAAPPEIEITVDPDWTPEILIAELDERLTAMGRPARHIAPAFRTV